MARRSQSSNIRRRAPGEIGSRDPETARVDHEVVLTVSCPRAGRFGHEPIRARRAPPPRRVNRGRRCTATSVDDQSANHRSVVVFPARWDEEAEDLAAADVNLQRFRPTRSPKRRVIACAEITRSCR